MKDFKEFLGLTVPKLYILLKKTDNKNNILFGNENDSINYETNNLYTLYDLNNPSNS